MIAAHNSTIILAGEFNVNLLDKSPGSPGQKFLKLTEPYNLRVCNTSVPTYKPAGSLLDAILTNCNIVLRSGVSATTARTTIPLQPAQLFESTSQGQQV